MPILLEICCFCSQITFILAHSWTGPYLDVSEPRRKFVFEALCDVTNPITYVSAKIDNYLLSVPVSPYALHIAIFLNTRPNH